MKLELRTEEDSTPRRSWVALLLSVAMMGLGQAYNGQWRFGLALWLLLVLVFMPAYVGAALWLPSNKVVPGLVLVVLAMALIYIYSFIQAWVQARRSNPYQLKRWQKWWAYIALFLAANFVVLPLLSTYIRNHIVQPFTVSTGSMAPTLKPGEMIIADMRLNCDECRGEIQRGDLVVFYAPKQKGVVYVKRIIGLAGDEIRTDGNEIFINNEALAWLLEKNTAQRAVSSMGTITVPSGQVFVVGDNRQNSRDSRHFGTIPSRDVIGRVKQIIWSRGEGGVRWSRVGHVPN